MPQRHRLDRRLGTCNAAAASGNGTLGVVGDSPVDVSPGGAEGTPTPGPCMHSDVSVRCGRADLARQLSVSSREIPSRTPVDGTQNLTYAALPCLPLAIKPPVEDGTVAEVDRHAVSVASERGEVSDRGRGPGSGAAAAQESLTRLAAFVRRSAVPHGQQIAPR
jgi:hypothetical protein